jgi:hypothetical protein
MAPVTGTIVFRNVLRRPAARLMIIGYRLSDAHITDAIMDAIKQSDLKVFLVDPSTDNIFDKRDPELRCPIALARPEPSDKRAFWTSFLR